MTEHEHEHDYDNDEKHQEALERITARLLEDRVARRRSASHSNNTRAARGHGHEHPAEVSPIDRLADSYLRTEALARVLAAEHEGDGDEEDVEFEDTLTGPRRVHSDAIKQAALTLRAKGLGYAEIARRVRAHPSCVRKWCEAHARPPVEPVVPVEPVELELVVPVEPVEPVEPAPVEPASVEPAPVEPVETPQGRYEEASPQTRARAVTLHAQGVRYSAIARELGVTPANVRNWCLRASRPHAPKTPKTPKTPKEPKTMTRDAKYDAETRAKALKLRALGHSLSHVSKQTGVPRGTIHDWAKAAGLTSYLPRVEPKEPKEPTEPKEPKEPTESTEHTESIEPTELTPPTPPTPQVLQRLAQIATQIKELEDERAKLLAPLRARRAALLQELATLNATLEGAPQD